MARNRQQQAAIMPLQHVDFIDNDPAKGRIYDWSLVEREFRKLGVPDEFNSVDVSKFQNTIYDVYMSERSRAKTTCGILKFLVWARLYGGTLCYIRSSKTENTATNLLSLFGVICQYNEGHYIKTITGGEYNSIRYHRNTKTFHYANYDADDSFTECEAPIMRCLTIEERMNYKSTLNVPDADAILWDECINPNRSSTDLWIFFLDLLSTITRDRLSSRVLMLCNNLDTHSYLFDDMEIRKSIRTMEKGEYKTITTRLGTKIFFAILGDAPSRLKCLKNEMFYGFDNPKMASITGSAVWAMKNYPHIPRDKGTVIIDNLYMETTDNEYLKLDIVELKDIGEVGMFVHRATRTYEDSIIITLNEDHLLETSAIYLYGLGTENMRHMFRSILTKHLDFYSTNGVGTDFQAYLLNLDTNKMRGL